MKASEGSGKREIMMREELGRKEKLPGSKRELEKKKTMKMTRFLSKAHWRKSVRLK